MLRFAVVGLGFGQQHVRTLANLPDAQLVAVADRNPKLEKTLYEDNYGAKVYRNAEELLDKETLDALIISIAPKHRDTLIERAAQKDVALFVEKPWGTNLEHAEELAALCAKHNARVMVGFSFRYHPAIVKLRELLENDLGAPWLLNAEYLFDWLPPAENWLWDKANGGGFFNENSCHLFDAICYLLGEPVSVYAAGSSFSGRPSEDGVAVTLRFKNGAVATATLGGIGVGAHKDYPRLDLVSANGQAKLRGQTHIWTSLRWARRGEQTVQQFEASPEQLGRTRYTDALEHFITCIKENKAPSATVQDGIRSVQIAEAIYASLETGQVVQLKETV